MRLLFCLIISIFLWACNSHGTNKELFAPGKDRGPLNKKLFEASGVVASVTNPGFLWTLNDSGNPAEVFLIDDHARIRLICKLAKINNRDWEDLAIGASPEAGKNYLYVGEIGDNKARYNLKYVYRFQEPTLSPAKELMVKDFDTLILKLPDGKRDAETLMIDPLTNDLFIVSKREPSVGLYHAPYPFGHDTIVMKKLGELPFTGIVSGSISRDGHEVLLKDYAKVYYWKRLENEDLLNLLTRPPIELPYKPEPQGEGIGWANDGSGFYTVSESPEGHQAQLRFYKRN